MNRVLVSTAAVLLCGPALAAPQQPSVAASRATPPVEQMVWMLPDCIPSVADVDIGAGPTNPDRLAYLVLRHAAVSRLGLGTGTAADGVEEMADSESGRSQAGGEHCSHSS